MEPIQPPDTNAFTVAIAAFFAMIGGLVRELAGEGQHTLKKFIGGALVGIFCGLVVFCFCRHFGWEGWLTGALTGLGGYMGTPLLDLISAVIKKRIKKDTE